MAVIMASGWFQVAGRPELRADKTAQREFVLTAMAAAGLPTLGQREHPQRLDRDEILGPWLARTRADRNELVKRNVAWHCLDCNFHFEAVYPPTCPLCKRTGVRE
jgi:rubrerythrin